MKPLIALTVAGLKSFVRDRSGLFWSFFFPVFFLVIFGSIFGGRRNSEAMKFKVGIVVQDTAQAAEWVPGVFTKIPVLETSVGDLETETAELLKGKRQAVVVFPADFSERFMAQRPSDIRVIYDPSQQQIAPMVTGILRQVVDGIDKRMSGRATLLRSVEEPIALPSGSSNERPKGTDFLVPGIVAMTIMQLGLFTAIPLVIMREKGILKRFRATPLPRTYVVASQVLQRMIIVIAQTMTIVVMGMVLFKFKVLGSWITMIGLATLGVLTFISIGAILSSIAKTQESAGPMVQLVMLPMMFLSGMFFPTEFMPASFQPIVRMLPSTYLADGLRHTMLAAPSNYSLQTDIIVMGSWLVVSLVVASRTFKWE